MSTGAKLLYDFADVGPNPVSTAKELKMQGSPQLDGVLTG